MDLIDRKAALFATAYGDPVCDVCRKAIMKVPSAQPDRSHWVEVRWEDDSGNISSLWACHNCGSRLFYRSHYCPDCGADMRNVHREE